jgi:ATP-dependent DNA helicase RecQ
LHKERNQKFGAGQCIDVLLGKKTDKVMRWHHDELSVFGVGADLREVEWRAVIRQALAQGLLAVEGDYGTLVLTEASGAVLSRQRQVMLRREPERPISAAKAAKVAKQRSATATAELSPEAAPRFERLRAWRAATAKDLAVPAYVIFHDSTLRQIAAEAPTSLAQLSTVSGVGENKLAKFGQQILDTLAAVDA